VSSAEADADDDNADDDNADDDNAARKIAVAKAPSPSESNAGASVLDAAAGGAGDMASMVLNGQRVYIPRHSRQTVMTAACSYALART
jgi:hypothetical protein